MMVHKGLQLNIEVYSLYEALFIRWYNSLYKDVRLEESLYDVLFGLSDTTVFVPCGFDDL